MSQPEALKFPTNPTSAERPEDGPLSLENDEAITTLRVVLDAANYTDTTIREALGTHDEFSFRKPDVPLYLRRLPKESKLSTLVKLFLLGVAVDSKQAAVCLEPLSVKRLEAMGLLERGTRGTRSRVRITPYDGLLFACDRYVDDSDGPPSNYVMGVNPTSITLAALTVR